jgi:hypothetical protein
MSKSDDEAKLKKYYDRLLDKHNLKNSRYLVSWFNRKVEELINLPDTVDRSGITKGDRLPAPRGKKALALHELAFPKSNLKEFCEVMGANYGSARNWRATDDVFPKLVKGYASEFIQTFVADYEKYVESDDPKDLVKAICMIRESRRYSRDRLSHMPDAIYKAIEERIKAFKNKFEMENITKLRNHELIYHLMQSYCEADTEERQGLFKAEFNSDIDHVHESFDHLMQFVQRDEGKVLAEKIRDDIKHHFLRYALILSEMID